MNDIRTIHNWKESVKRGGRRLAKEFEENPVMVIGVCGVAIGATAKLLKVGVEIQNARVWKKEVARRAMMTKAKSGRYPMGSRG